MAKVIGQINRGSAAVARPLALAALVGFGTAAAVPLVVAEPSRTTVIVSGVVVGTLVAVGVEVVFYFWGSNRAELLASLIDSDAKLERLAKDANAIKKAEAAAVTAASLKEAFGAATAKLAA